MDNNLENSLNESVEGKDAEQVDTSIEEVAPNEETLVEKEEVIEDSTILKNDEDNKKDKESTGFIQLFIANFADVTAISALTFIGIFLFKLLLKVGGWRVKSGSDIIIYLISFICDCNYNVVIIPTFSVFPRQH